MIITKGRPTAAIIEMCKACVEGKADPDTIQMTNNTLGFIQLVAKELEVEKEIPKQEYETVAEVKQEQKPERKQRGRPAKQKSDEE